jgi:hypothetical protein
VVKDGNLITAGGVTSGIDFGLSVVAEIAGETTPTRDRVRPGATIRFGPSRSGAGRHQVDVVRPL